MITFNQSSLKAQRLAKSNNADVLTQLKQDINTGYHMFNAKLARYYSRKQQFTDLIAGQQIYQTPIDCVKVLGMTVQVTANYQPTVKQVRSEYDWRQIVSWQTDSNWPAWYFMIGNDELSLWPIPSQDVTNGLRFYYQPQDHDLSLDDITSTSNSSGGTVTVTVANGSTLVTSTSAIFTSQMIGLSFQVNGVTDLSWYEIVDVPTTATLTLKSAYVGISGSGMSWTIGQTMIIPQEYQDAPMHYALGNFWSAQGNEPRSQYHLGTQDKPGMFYNLMTDCLESYSSSNESSVIDESDMYLNPWTYPPVPAP